MPSQHHQNIAAGTVTAEWVEAWLGTEKCGGEGLVALAGVERKPWSWLEEDLERVVVDEDDDEEAVCVVVVSGMLVVEMLVVEMFR